jgi:hypothetical protein
MVLNYSFFFFKNLSFLKNMTSPIDKPDRSFATSVDKLRLSRSLSTGVVKLRPAWEVKKKVFEKETTN